MSHPKTRKYPGAASAASTADPIFQHLPFLRWAGSKRQILHRLREYWHRRTFNRYVEPFCGSSSLFFHIGPARAVLGDLNRELIEVYEVVRDDPRQVFRHLARLPKSRACYLALRQQDPTLLTRLDRVVRFVYLNCFCFNGIYRTNTAGQFNVPYAEASGRIPSQAHLMACADVLERATLRAGDFGSTLRLVRPNDFVYLDPPYAVASRRVFRHYGAKTFERRDLVRLTGHLRRINSLKAYFLLSYADCRDVRESLAEWPMRRIRVRRHVAGFTGARRNAYELLVSNIPDGVTNGNERS